MSDAIKFLIVDDSNISRKWFIATIPDAFKKNIETIEASNGKSALEIYKEQKIDIVFLDITMPDMNGFEVLEKLKELDANATVIMVSADRQKSTKAKVLEMGASGVLNKPVEADKLREVLLELMQ